MTTIALPRTPSTPLARLAIWTLSGWAVVQGFGIILGGPDRWVGPTFTVLRSVPGSTDTWGSVAALLGFVGLIASLTRQFKIKAVAMGGLAAWSAAFGVSTLYATFTIPTAATTGGPTYVMVAIVCAAMITVDETAP